MNRDPSSTASATERPLPPAQFASPDQPAPSDLSSTMALAGQIDPAARVLAQMDGLSASLEREVASGQNTTPHPGLRRTPEPTAADDECLESYLQQYMQRLTGKAHTETSGACGASATSPATPAKPAAPQKPLPSIEDRLPISAPEDRDQITALRALANDSARRAVAESSQIQQVVLMRRAYFEAKAASIASTTLAIAFFATGSTIALTSAAFLFTVALLLSYRFMRLCIGKAA